MPGALLQTSCRRASTPQQAVVLVRRGPATAKASGPRFVVAAVAAEGGAISVGTEVPGDTGEIGYAAEAQIVVSRADLRRRDRAGPHQARSQPCLAGLNRSSWLPSCSTRRRSASSPSPSRASTSGDAKAALRLIAQTGGAGAPQRRRLHARSRSRRRWTGSRAIFNKRHMEQALSELIYRTACAAYDHRDSGSAGPAGSCSRSSCSTSTTSSTTTTRTGTSRETSCCRSCRASCTENIRKDDIFGRFGGEEFLLILPRTNLAQALAAANKIRGVIAAAQASRSRSGSRSEAISVSGGVAEYPLPRHGRA